MLEYEQLIETIGSFNRIRLLKLLIDRPRCLVELAEDLDISPQAVLKHLKILQEKRFVSCIESDGTLGSIKKLYSLISTVNIYLNEKDNFAQIQIFKDDRKEISDIGPKYNKQELYEKLQNIARDEYVLKRRLKSMREKEKRIVQEIFYLENLKRQIIKKTEVSKFEEIVFDIALSKNIDKEIIDFSKYFGLNEKTIQEYLRDFFERMK